MTNLHNYLIENKYAVLLASFGLLLFGSILIPFEPGWNWQAGLLIQNIAVCVFLFSENKKRKWCILAILITILGFEFSGRLYGWKAAGIFITALYALYFLIISFKVYYDIYKAKKIDVEMISAVFCGLIIIGLIAFLYLFTIETNTPNSFPNFGSGMEKFQDIQHFNFITTLTFDYGDFALLAIMTRKSTMLLGLLCHFYTVFVMSIVIGKHLQINREH